MTNSDPHQVHCHQDHPPAAAPTPPPAVVFLPIPIVGHLVSMVELAKRLAPHFSVVFLTMRGAPHPSWATSAAAFLDSAAPATTAAGIRFVELPAVDFTVDPARHAVTTMAHFVDAHRSHAKVALQHLSEMPGGVAGVITDFVTSMVDVAAELGLPGYVYLSCGSACLSIMAFPPVISDVGDEGDVAVLGISPVPRRAMPEPMTDPDGSATFAYHGRRLHRAKGVVINTFYALESTVLDALRRADPHHALLPPILPVGPIISLPAASGSGGPNPRPSHECVRWLDRQPVGSVVFLCFGNFGCFGADQAKEIARGLERSGHRFLWVLRSPPKDPNDPPGDADLEEVLPEGFLRRTADRGLVWPSWAPQREALGHPAVGGFLTHCGWNSCLESVWAGVPMLAWPLYAEQGLNARQMIMDMEVALELAGVDGGSVVLAEEVEKGVRCLMEDDEKGKKVRRRVRELREESRRAVAGGGGSSFLAMEKWVMEMLASRKEGNNTANSSSSSTSSVLLGVEKGKSSSWGSILSG